MTRAIIAFAVLLALAVASNLSGPRGSDLQDGTTTSEVTMTKKTLRVWPAFAVQPLLLSQGALPPPGAGSKFRHLHPWFRGPDPETTSRVTE